MTTFQNIRCRIDSASACKQDIITYLNKRVSEVEILEFDPERERQLLKTLKKSYAQSVYSAVSDITEVSLKAKAMEASADLAVKEARYKALQEQEVLSQQLRLNEFQLEGQKKKLLILKVKQDMEESAARYRALSQAGSSTEFDVHSPKTQGNKQSSILNPEAPSFTALSPEAPPFTGSNQEAPSLTVKESQSFSEENLANAFTHAIDRSRRPVPTPKVFTGNSIEFVGFKRSVRTLIERKGLSAEEKIYYLQQYVSGEPRDAIAGCFYGSEEGDYLRAWEKLEKTVWTSF